MGRTNRQAASQHREACRPGGEALRAFVRRKRQVDATVVEGVLTAWLQTPFSGPTALLARVHRRVGRHDLRGATLASALAPIAGVPVRRTLRRQLEAGQVHAQEAWRLTARRESLSLAAPPPAGWSGPSADRGRRLADPTALAALVTPELPLAPVPGALCWLTFLLTLFSGHVPLAVLGRWCGVHKTTLRRGG